MKVLLSAFLFGGKETDFCLSAALYTRVTHLINGDREVLRLCKVSGGELEFS